MNQAIKAEWIAALRSGEYEQTAGGLKGDGKYCCLGVLCDIAAKQGQGHWTVSDVFVTNTGETAHLLLPHTVAKWAELPHYNPRVGPEYEDDWRYGLADYNDGVEGTDMDMLPRTFAEIADLIEADL